MIIIEVTFTDWNGNERTIKITSDNCIAFNNCKNDVDLFTLAIKYVERRWIECYNINKVEVIAR